MGPLSGIHDKFPSRGSFAISLVRVVSGYSPHSNTSELNESGCEMVTQVQRANHTRIMGNIKILKNKELFSITERLPIS